MPSPAAIGRLVESLEGVRLSRVFNPWGEDCKYDAVQRAHYARQSRLTAHLDIERPSLILVGEAPSWRGGRYSGIAFCSEALLLTPGSIPRVSLAGRITTLPNVLKEPSAKVVWGAAYTAGIAEGLVTFNALPFHPHGDTPHSNRTPAPTEVALGSHWLEALLDLYPDGTPVAAVGQLAHASLTALKVEHTLLRHPAFGGATLFRSQFADLAAKLPPSLKAPTRASPGILM